MHACGRSRLPPPAGVNDAPPLGSRGGTADRARAGRPPHARPVVRADGGRRPARCPGGHRPTTRGAHPRAGAAGAAAGRGWRVGGWESHGAWASGWVCPSFTDGARAGVCPWRTRRPPPRPRARPRRRVRGGECGLRRRRHAAAAARRRCGSGRVRGAQGGTAPATQGGGEGGGRSAAPPPPRAHPVGPAPHTPPPTRVVGLNPVPAPRALHAARLLRGAARHHGADLPPRDPARQKTQQQLLF